MTMNRMDLKRWSRGNPNCMYCDIGLRLPAKALLRVSHENRDTGNGRYLNFPHEGLDFALYQDDAGKIHSLDQGTRIPAMSAGVVRSIFSDYLGQAIVVEQVDVEKEGSRRISIYAHTVPLTGVHPGTIIDEGDVIATIADTSRSKVTIRPHLHYTLGQLLGAVVYEQFVWNCMRDPHRVELLDPLILLDCPHRIIASPVVSKSPWQTGK
jgi:murein DD-endopeptidase MepM/ murein hydrolase activator NlpD